MKLALKKSLLVSKESILNKEHNLWMGYSHGNKWFTSENIRALIDFGVTYTKESFLIWIPGRIYATNFKYIEEKSRAEALRLAFELEEKMMNDIKKIVRSLPKEIQKKIVLSSYIKSYTLTFLNQREVLMKEFSMQLSFYKSVMEIAIDILTARKRTVSKDRAESVSLYILQELPCFLDGISKIGENSIHNVIIYPGMGKIDYLVENIKKNKEYSLLRKKLKLTNTIGIADVQ